MATDSIGTGLFLPFTVLYFLRTTPLSASTIGVALTAAGLVALPTPLALTRAMDRLPVRTVVAVGNLISAVAFIGYVFVDTPGELFAAALVAQIGQATFWTATRALIGQVTRPQERRSWFAFQTATRNAGYGLGGLVGASAVGAGGPAGLHALALVDAASYAVAAGLLLSWQDRRAIDPARDTEGQPYQRVSDASGSSALVPNFRAALTDLPLMTVTLVNAAFVLCAGVLTVLISVYVVTQLHLPGWLAGLLFSMNTALVVLAQAPVTARTRHYPAARALRLAALGLAVSFATLWAIANAPTAVAVTGLVAAVVVFTLAGILEGPTINALVVDIAPTHAPGRHLAIFQLSWSIGSAAAPVVLLSLYQAGVAWLWASLITICALIVLAAQPLARAPAPPAK
jgi:MFS family permease